MQRGWRRLGARRTGGWGFGFRGSSPPWPFIGVGRGGLPRCGYFLSHGYWFSAYFSGVWPGVPQGGYPAGGAYSGATAQGSSPGQGAYPYASPTSREQELELLKAQAEALTSQMEQIENRIRELQEE